MDSQMPDINHPQSYLVRSRITLIMIFVVFAAPVLIAYLFLKTGYYASKPTSNKGDLIATQISVSSLQLHNFDPNKKWWLLYVAPTQCDKSCENSLYQMRQVRTALGEEMSRVERVVVHVRPPEEKISQLLQTEFKEFKQAEGDSSQVNLMLENALEHSIQAGTLNTPLQHSGSAIESGRIYVVDPMGFIMLSYPSYADEHESILKGKLILKDLTKLLKESRIG